MRKTKMETATEQSPKSWVTQLQAIDPKDGELKTWGGPVISRETEEGARIYCDTHGLGYLKIVGEHVAPSTEAQDSTEKA